MALRFFIIICATVLSLGIPPSVFAQEKPRIDPKTVPNAEALIKHCLDISEEKRSSGGTTLMRQGGMDTIMCLEKVIISHASALIVKTAITKEEIAEILKNIRTSYGRLYWNMHNNNKGCFPRCGTENYLSSSGQIMWQFEEILRDVIKLRQENEK